MIYKFLVPKNLFLSFFFFFFFFFLASSFISFRRLDLSNYYTHTHPILSERQLYTFISIYLYVCVCAALSLIIAVAHTANGHNITRMFFSIALLFFFFSFLCVDDDLFSLYGAQFSSPFRRLLPTAFDVCKSIGHWWWWLCKNISAWNKKQTNIASNDYAAIIIINSTLIATRENI